MGARYLHTRHRLPRDLVDLVKAYAAGELGTLEFVSRLEARARASARAGP